MVAGTFELPRQKRLAKPGWGKYSLAGNPGQTESGPERPPHPGAAVSPPRKDTDESASNPPGGIRPGSLVRHDQLTCSRSRPHWPAARPDACLPWAPDPFRVAGPVRRAEDEVRTLLPTLSAPGSPVRPCVTAVESTPSTRLLPAAPSD